MSTLTTFLFTDIGGSSRLWELHPERMPAALAAHDALSREAVTRNRGRVVKMAGDGIHAAFAHPVDALLAAVDIQRALRDPAATNGLALRVRCGVHAGEAEERDGDFYGAPVNRAARLATAANEGQVIFTRTVLERAGSLPEPLQAKNLGEVRLRDLSQAEAIFQLDHPDLPADYPPLRSLANNPNNLPNLLTSFIGRRKLVIEVADAFRRARLVTLLGPGGIGKTRTALQAAAWLLDRYRDGVWFVELASLSDPALLAATVARALGVREQRGMTIEAAVIAHCRERSLLVVLDNCEHLIDGCAHFADALLRAASRTHILATSRQGLEIDGEAAIQVPTLPRPDPDFAWTQHKLVDVESVRLFIERAMLHDADFAIADAQTATLAQLCFRLDGIPLAIELAAARLRTHTLEQIAAGVADRFGLFTTGSRVAPARQKTLRAMIDWSYDLLSSEERDVFARLSVFAGGWTDEAAATVCADESIDASRVAAVIADLADKSLVQVEEGPSGPRRRLLETMREYAGEKLVATGDEERRRALHAATHLALTEEARPAFANSSYPPWMARLHAERDNLRRAFGWLKANDGRGALRCANNLARYWVLGAEFVEGLAMLTGALAIETGPEAEVDRARAAVEAAGLSYVSGDLDAALRWSTQAEHLARRHGLASTLGLALVLRAFVTYIREGHLSAEALFVEAIDTMLQAGDKRTAGHHLQNLANNALYFGDIEAANAYRARSEAIAVELDDPWFATSIASGRTQHAFHLGEYERSVAEAREFVRLSDAIGDKMRLATAYMFLGAALARCGELREAASTSALAVQRLHEAVQKLELVNAIESFASVLAQAGDHEEACRLVGAMAAAREALDFPVGGQGRAMIERALGPGRAVLDDARRAALLAEGRAIALDAAVARILERAPAVGADSPATIEA